MALQTVLVLSGQAFALATLLVAEVGVGAEAEAGVVAEEVGTEAEWASHVL